jgi:hypothetical protein
VASTLPVLALLAAVTATGGQPRGSAQFQVSVRVVAPMRARAPAVAELHRPASPTGTAAGAPYVLPAGGQGNQRSVVARLVPTVALRGGTAAALIGVSGQRSVRCADGGCELALSHVATTAADAETVVVTFLPDGAPTGLIER